MPSATFSPRPAFRLTEEHIALLRLEYRKMLEDRWNTAPMSLFIRGGAVTLMIFAAFLLCGVYTRYRQRHPLGRIGPRLRLHADVRGHRRLGPMGGRRQLARRNPAARALRHDHGHRHPPRIGAADHRHFVGHRRAGLGRRSFRIGRADGHHHHRHPLSWAASAREAS